MSRHVLLLATLFAPFIAAANESVADSKADQEIEEVLVTATRRSVSRDEISSGLTLVDRQQLQSKKLVTDSLAANVGAFLQQTTPGQGAVIIRGLKGSSILHLVDGLRLNNAIFRSAPTQYLSLVPVSAVERAEVLRGTPTSLYGNDAVGGAVQLVTRKPVFESSETSVRGEAFASFDTAELGKTLRATVDVGNSELVSSFSAEYLETGNRRIGGGARIGPSGYTSKGARMLVSATPAGNHSWLLDMHYLEQPETPRVDELIPGFGQQEPSSSEFSFAPNRRVFVHGRYARSDGLAGLDWSADVAWQRVDDDRATRNFLADERRLEANSSDLYGLTITGTKTHGNGSWVVGAEFYYDRVHSERREQDLSGGASRVVASRFPDGAAVRQAALYANVQRFVADRHSVSGGLRISSDDVSLPATTVSPRARIDSVDVSADAGWMMTLNSRWQLVANIGLGFRAPNVFDLGTLGNRPGNRFNIPNTALDSEHVLQADVGLRYRSDRATLELMAYALRYDDRITSVSTGEVTADGRDIVQSVNAAESSIRGLEFGADIRVTDNFNALAVLNYTWGEQGIAGEPNEAADRIPPLNGRISLSYDRGGDTRIEARWIFAAGQDRLSARDIDDIRIDPLGTAGWSTLGVSLQRDVAQNWLFDVSLDNLLDRRYRVHGSGLDAPGRSFALSVRRSW